MDPASSSRSSPAPIILLDGGLGTTLTDNHGCKFNETTPLWSSHLLIDDTPTLLACQSSFAQAGAECILTATYQASFRGFAATGVNRDLAEMYMRNAVLIARGSFNGRGFSGSRGKVVLSLGAYGATMIPSQEYGGNYDRVGSSVASLRRWHWDRIQTFIPGAGLEEPFLDVRADANKLVSKENCWRNIGLVAFETLPVLREIIAVRDVMADVRWHVDEGKEGQTMKEFWISCVFPGEEMLLPDGSTIQEVIDAMLGYREGSETPMGVGINCTKVEKLERLVQAFESAVTEVVKRGELTEWPSLVIYPDGTNGEVYNTTTQQWEKRQSGNEGSAAQTWDEVVHGITKRAQARGNWESVYVGGCCKVTPKDIGKLKASMVQS